MRQGSDRGLVPDGVVGRVFPLRCYGYALAALPVDYKDFSTGHEDIVRAYTERCLELHRGQRSC